MVQDHSVLGLQLLIFFLSTTSISTEWCVPPDPWSYFCLQHVFGYPPNEALPKKFGIFFFLSFFLLAIILVW